MDIVSNVVKDQTSKTVASKLYSFLENGEFTKFDVLVGVYKDQPTFLHDVMHVWKHPETGYDLFSRAVHLNQLDIVEMLLKLKVFVIYIYVW